MIENKKTEIRKSKFFLIKVDPKHVLYNILVNKGCL